MPQKKNPDPLELVRGKSRPRDRPPDRLAGDDEGAARRVQQGSAGRQGSALRRGGHVAAARLRGGRQRHRRLDAQRRTHRRARHRACCWRPMSPTISSRRGMPFRDAHEVVGALVRRLLKEGRVVRRSLDWTNGASIRRSSTTTCATRSRRWRRSRKNKRRSRPARRRSLRRSLNARNWHRRL